MSPKIESRLAFTCMIATLISLCAALFPACAQVEPVPAEPVTQLECALTPNEFDGGCASSGCWQPYNCNRAPVVGDVVFESTDGTRWVEGVNSAPTVHGYACTAVVGKVGTFKCVEVW